MDWRSTAWFCPDVHFGSKAVNHNRQVSTQAV